ncbi:AP-1 complex subunit gamma-1 [Planoprotostelium fungivorum]|uniref:AP-1 complex subunit gamma n=1 Tax=Planoprotostelium fungivorum TaxID=1890364 RepID=A0A2P6N0P7_9EUKA|nr:AP-1 complex subunit gamma-1 [Planoprotostelium fungivorum]
MSRRLKDLIKAARGAKTAAEEREVIQKECAAIRTSFKQEEADYRHRNVAKLLYISMLGYPTQWGQMECLKLIASSGFSDKRIGYLALMLLLDEKQEILILVTSHMKNDLNSNNQFIAGLALCALGNISSQGIARDLAPDVEKLLGSTNPYLRKKAALCAIRVLRKCPDLMENFVPRIRSLLSDRNHGVLLTGVTLMTELCETDAANIEYFRRLVPTLVRVLKNLVMSGFAPEYDVNGITDPYLQVKILKLLRILGKGDAESTDIMNDILAQVATNTDHSRNVGNAVLYECVQTIMNIEAEDGLRLLAINVLGRFLGNKDNNIRYVALATLGKVVSADVEAVQRHRNTIVDCLKDPDTSIRKRALELIYALVNESNIKILAHELITFLQTATVEFRADLAVNLCRVTERYSPNKRWQVDTILRVLQIAGNCVPDEVCYNLINLVASSPELHTYGVQKMYMSLTNDHTQQTLVQVASWSIGEFGDLLLSLPASDREINVTENDVIDLFDKILRDPATTPVTKDYILTALMKLTSRFPSGQKLKSIISRYQSNIDLELQQRAVEYSKLFAWEGIRDSLLERIPVLEQREMKTATVATANGTGEANLLDWDDGPTTTSQQPSSPTPAPAAAAPAASSGLDILSEIFGSSAPVSTTTAPVNNVAAADPLDFLSALTPVASTPAPAPVAAPTPAAPLNGPLPTQTVFQKNGVTVYFDIMKQASTPNITLINASFSNANPFPVANFDFKVAVPKYIRLQVNTPSGNLLPPNNSGRVSQSFKLLNSNHGEKPLLVKIKLDYMANGAPGSDMADVSFPEGC